MTWQAGCPPEAACLASRTTLGPRGSPIRGPGSPLLGAQALASEEAAEARSAEAPERSPLTLCVPSASGSAPVRFLLCECSALRDSPF